MRYGTITAFTIDLTGQPKQLCAWVAEQASAGVRSVTYDDVQLALGICDDREVTCILREIRERLDDVHSMVQFPIVNTPAPYFDIHRNADYIWDDYCRAEWEYLCSDCESQSSEIQGIDHSQRDRVVCCV